MRSETQEQGVAMDMKWTKVLFLSLILVLGAVGCGEEDHVGTPTASDFLKERQSLATHTAKPKPAAAATAAAAKAVEGEEAEYASTDRDYFYDSRGKRDPFRSFRFVDDEDSSKDESFGPLGDFEVGQLELSAVIWDASNPRALILDPGGRAYIVREGSQIGKNSGQVIHIGDNLVLVKETYENLAGEQTTKDVEMRIRLSQGG